MDVDFDFSDVEQFFEDGGWEVEKKMIDMGGAALYAEKRLKEEFEK